MTICIGSLCLDGQAVVFAADRMVTAHFLSLEFEHQEKKIEKVNETCVIMSSGDALVAFELIEAFRRDSGGARSVAEIATRFYDLLSQLSLRRAEQQVLMPRGLTWDRYRADGNSMNPQLYMLLDHQLSEFHLETDFLVVGIDERGGHVISLIFPGTVQHFDKIGFGAVGSGIPHATTSLCLDGQTRKRKIAETLYAVYVSKRKAESAPGVGKETDLGVITKQGICFLEPDQLKDLENLYNKQLKTDVDLASVEKVCEKICPQKQQ
jgi:20S proteasome alpha/beta subunit